MLGSLETLILTTATGLFSGIVLASINHLFGVARDKRKEARAQVAQASSDVSQQEADAQAFTAQLYDVPKGRTDMEKEFLSKLPPSPAYSYDSEVQRSTLWFWALLALGGLVVCILLTLWNSSLVLSIVSILVSLFVGVWITRRVLKQ